MDQIIKNLVVSPEAWLSEFILSLAGDNIQSLPKAASRGDWLYVEWQVTQTLTRLVWLARILGITTEQASLENILRAFCSRTGSEPSLDVVLNPKSLREQASATLEVIVGALDFIHREFDGIHEEREDWLRGSFPHRNNPPHAQEVTHLEGVAESISQSLRQMPGCDGAVLTGSFAVPSKRDGLNDLDFAVFCSEMPDDTARDEFLSRMELKPCWRSQAFEYFQLKGVDIHMCFILTQNQCRAVDYLFETGDESRSATWTDPNYALSAYGLSHAQIRFERQNIITSQRSRLTSYPESLERQIIQLWTPELERYRSRAQDAIQAGDRAHGLLALNRSTEALIRLELAHNHVYANATELKWLKHDLEHLAWEKHKHLERAIALARCSVQVQQEARLKLNF